MNPFMFSYSNFPILSIFLVLHEFFECLLLQCLILLLILHEFTHVLISVLDFEPVHPSRSS